MFQTTNQNGSPVIFHPYFLSTKITSKLLPQISLDLFQLPKYDEAPNPCFLGDPFIIRRVRPPNDSVQLTLQYVA